MNYFVKSISLLGFLLLSVGAQATDWQVNNAQSKLSFVSTKKVNIAEVHSFGQLSGGLSAAGQFALDIDLNSVNTNIDIRDSRMKEFLFDVIDFPAAQITAMIEPELVNAMTVGQQELSAVAGKLELHGQSQELNFDVVITKLADDTLFVVSATPVILNVADYQLVGGVEKLRELAGLPSISLAVPVSFYLTLNAAN